MPMVGFISLLRCPTVAVTERGAWAGRERSSQAGQCPSTLRWALGDTGTHGTGRQAASSCTNDAQ